MGWQVGAQRALGGQLFGGVHVSAGPPSAWQQLLSLKEQTAPCLAHALHLPARHL